MFASLDWLPTFVEIAGGPKGDGLKKQLEAGSYPDIVKTTLDGVNQIDYLTGKSDKSARDVFYYFSGATPSAVRYKNWKMYYTMSESGAEGWILPAHPLPLDVGAEHQARSVRAGSRHRPEERHEPRGRTCRSGDRLHVRLEHAANRPAVVARLVRDTQGVPADAVASQLQPHAGVGYDQGQHGASERVARTMRRRRAARKSRPPFRQPKFTMNFIPQLTTPRTKMKYKQKVLSHGLSLLTATAALIGAGGPLQAEEKKPNIVMLMTDDTGWNDFGCYSGGGAGLGHPTPNVDRIAKEGAVFTSWYGQASCTAGRASFMTGRIPIRSALSIVVAPGDENYLRKETPTIAEFFQEERLHDVLLRQVAYGRQTRVPIRPSMALTK